MTTRSRSIQLDYLRGYLGSTMYYSRALGSMIRLNDPGGDHIEYWMNDGNKNGPDYVPDERYPTYLQDVAYGDFTGMPITSSYDEKNLIDTVKGVLSLIQDQCGVFSELLQSGLEIERGGEDED